MLYRWTNKGFQRADPFCFKVESGYLTGEYALLESDYRLTNVIQRSQMLYVSDKLIQCPIYEDVAYKTPVFWNVIFLIKGRRHLEAVNGIPIRCSAYIFQVNTISGAWTTTIALFVYSWIMLHLINIKENGVRYLIFMINPLNYETGYNHTFMKWPSSNVDPLLQWWPQPHGHI